MAAAQRGNNARKERRQESNAASNVQASIRGRNTRKENEQKKQASTVVQKNIRGKKARGRVAGQQSQRYYTPAEVAEHNRIDDLWVSFFHKVYDLTALVAANPGALVQPLIDASGTDITHWFDPVTKGLRMYIDPTTELEVPFLPMGRFLHAGPDEPSAAWSTEIGTPWWKDKELCVGTLTQKTRRLKLLNMLTKQETILEVCMEETLLEIQKRYIAYNEHAASYTWKRTDAKVGRVLDMHKTLDENDVPDETPTFDALSIDEDFYVPTLHLYFSDDLTVA